MDRRRTRAAERMFPYPRERGTVWRWMAFVVVLTPGAALAQMMVVPSQPVLEQTHFTPYADGAYQYNSNLYAESDAVPAPVAPDGKASRADAVFTSRVGFESAYDIGQQEFFADVEGRRLDYERFTDLDHNEYLLHGGLRWQVASLLDGVIDFERLSAQTSYLLFNAGALNTSAYTQLYLQVQDVGTASLNIQMSPEWRLQSLGKISDLKTPLPGEPDLALREDTVHEGLRYVGFANLSAGLDGEYLDGHFTSAEYVATPRYHQSTAELAATYVLSGLSSFNGAVGYTKRVQDNLGNVSGVTGVLAYQRALTGKTSINLNVTRALNSYVAYATTELDTSAQLAVTWNATAKISVVASYHYTYSDFPGSAAQLGYDRADHYQDSNFSVKYQALEWLFVEPSIEYRTRASNDYYYSFNGVLYGIEAQIRLFPAPQAF